MTNQPKPQPQKKLIVFPQDKGGIGKSFVATLLYDYLAEHCVKLKTFDLDHANSTFQRFFPEAQLIDIDVDANKLAVLDTVVNSLEAPDVALVDNRASGGTKVLRYIETRHRSYICSTGAVVRPFTEKWKLNSRRQKG